MASFSVSATTGLPAFDKAVDVPALCIREGYECNEPAHLGGVVVLDRRLEVLALRGRLAQLSAEPAQEAYCGLIRHAEQAIETGA
jgi:hypothetical protein